MGKDITAVMAARMNSILLGEEEELTAEPQKR
jgi:hypothetical protein